MVWYLVVNDNRIQHNAIMQKNTKTNKKTSCALRFLDGSICDDQVAAVTMSVIVQFLLNMTSLVFQLGSGFKGEKNGNVNKYDPGEGMSASYCIR